MDIVSITVFAVVVAAIALDAIWPSLNNRIGRRRDRPNDRIHVSGLLLAGLILLAA